MAVLVVVLVSSRCEEGEGVLVRDILEGGRGGRRGG